MSNFSTHDKNNYDVKVIRIKSCEMQLLVHMYEMCSFKHNQKIAKFNITLLILLFSKKHSIKKKYYSF